MMEGNTVLLYYLNFGSSVIGFPAIERSLSSKDPRTDWRNSGKSTRIEYVQIDIDR